MGSQMLRSPGNPIQRSGDRERGRSAWGKKGDVRDLDQVEHRKPLPSANAQQIKPVESAVVNLECKVGQKAPGIETFQQLVGVVPFHPRRSYAIGTIAPAMVRQVTLAPPADLRIAQFNPASPDWQV